MRSKGELPENNSRSDSSEDSTYKQRAQCTAPKPTNDRLKHLPKALRQSDDCGSGTRGAASGGPEWFGEKRWKWRTKRT